VPPDVGRQVRVPEPGPGLRPIPADAADQLRAYLRDRPANQPIWAGTWATARRGADMIRRDLEAAGIPYTVDGPGGPEHADFHSLRHSYLSLGGRSGIDLRTLQELAGHSTSKLTERYVHRRLYDLAGAVGKLPSILPPDLTAPAQPLAATGTDGAPGAVPGAVPGGADRHDTAPSYTLRVVGGVEGGVTEPQKEKPVGTSRHQPASIRTGVSDGIRTRDTQIHNLVL
jgi:hypothetical protein